MLLYVQVLQVGGARGQPVAMVERVDFCGDGVGELVFGDEVGQVGEVGQEGLGLGLGVVLVGGGLLF